MLFVLERKIVLEAKDSRSELRQEQRTGIKGKDVKMQVTAAYQSSDGPTAFRAALAARGYTLAQGDRRDYVIVDRKGGVHSLARRLDGVNARQLREYMAPLKREDVPTLEALKRLRDFKRDQGVREAYGQGNDYASQSTAALKDVARGKKKRKDNERQRREEQKAQPAPPVQKSEDAVHTGDRELTDGMQERVDRLRAAKLDVARPAEDPGRQSQAPGGGHTRSR